MVEEKNCQPRILYLTKLSFNNEEKTKAFLDETKLREFRTSGPALHEMLEIVFQAEMKEH